MADFYASSSAKPVSLVFTRDYGWTHAEPVTLAVVRSYVLGVDLTSGGSAPPPRPTVGLLYPR